jgi:hypothetical protein
MTYAPLPFPHPVECERCGDEFGCFCSDPYGLTESSALYKPIFCGKCLGEMKDLIWKEIREADAEKNRSANGSKSS